MLDGGPLLVDPGALPREFGAYTLLEEVARGGMGIVYRARQQPMNRTVALKVMVSGLFAAPDMVARFRIEADTAASLDHPNIVPVHEAGECDGQPFFSMKLIEGRSLAQRLAIPDSPMPQNEAAELLVKLARAVYYAHQRGVLHRDIKPGNVLLDAQGEPYLTDFGLAKLVKNNSALTRTTAMLGTPSYMSPEQARGDVKHLTIAADVYGLGAILYELLAGRPPFAGGSTMETVRLVLEKEAVRPSAINTAVDRDLDTICLKCLEKDAGRRYGSAEALAADLERWRRHEPILARPASSLERTAKWIRRHRGGFAALSTIALLLAGGISVSAWLAVKESKAREGEVKERIAAKEARAVAEANLTRAEWLVYAGKLMLARASFEAGNGGLALHYLDECRPDLRGWEWRYLWSRFNPIRTLKGEGYAVRSTAFSPDGKRIVTGGEFGTATVWDAASGRVLFSCKGHAGPVHSVAFNADGRFFATGCGDGTAKVWSATGGEVLTLRGHAGTVYSVAFSPNGDRIVTGSDNGSAKVWDRTEGRELFPLIGHTLQVYSVAFSPEGGRIVTTGWDGTARIWDAVTGKERINLRAARRPVRSVAFSPDGERILTGGDDLTARVWNARTGGEIGTLKGHKGVIHSVAFSPDGRRILTASGDQTAIVWDAGTCEELFKIRGHTGNVNSAVFSPDGKRIVTGGRDETAKIWDAVQGQELAALPRLTGDATSITFSPDSRCIATSGQDNKVRVWELATAREVLVLKMKASAANREGRMLGIWGVAFSPDGKRIVAGGEDESARVWDALTGEELVSLHHASGVSAVAFSPDNRRIVTGYGGRVEGVWGGDRQPGEAGVWDAATGAEVLTLRGHTGLLMSVAFSPDGNRIATGGWDHTAKIWDAATGRELFTLKGHTKYVWSVAFSPDSRRIVTGSHDKSARVWDVSSGQEVFALDGHTANVRAAAFSPDGSRIVTCSDDRTAKIWEAGTGLELFTTEEHAGVVWSAAFSPDGRHVATANIGEKPSVNLRSTAPAPEGKPAAKQSANR